MVKTINKLSILALILVISLAFSGCSFLDSLAGVNEPPIQLSDIPEFSGEPYVVINDGVPFFTDEEITTSSYESFSELDDLGRCGVAMACIGKDLMPTKERGDIGDVKPSGWQSVQYDCVSGKYLYNRCHLIGYQLTGENDNEKNLITGTRFMNWDGMVEFENMVADYIKDTGNHVMYRITPIFKSYELVARGVLMEAYSVEDNGEGISFNVYCYNNQPGVVINYFDGTSYLEGDAPPATDEGGSSTEEPGEDEVTYVLNTSSKRIHLPDCSSVTSMKPENKTETTKTLDELLEEGYVACGTCKPQ